MGRVRGSLSSEVRPVPSVPPLFRRPPPCRRVPVCLFIIYTQPASKKAPRHLLKSCFQKLHCAPGSLGLKACGHVPLAPKSHVPAWFPPTLDWRTLPAPGSLPGWSPRLGCLLPTLGPALSSIAPFLAPKGGHLGSCAPLSCLSGVCPHQ